MRKKIRSLITLSTAIVALIVGLWATSRIIKNTSEREGQMSKGSTSSYQNAILPTSPSEVLSTDTSEPSRIENVEYYSISSDKIRSYESLDDLTTASSEVIVGDCLNTATVYQYGNIYTLSQIKVQEVYKGNIVSGDTIWVVECGGRTTFGDYDANCMVDEKEFESSEDRLPDDYQIVIGMDGFYPLKQGESVLLFLGDTSGFLPDFNDTLYSVSGDTDGKLYAQEDGTYKKPSPSQTDNYIFEDGNLTITVAELQSIERD